MFSYRAMVLSVLPCSLLAWLQLRKALGSCVVRKALLHAEVA